MRGSLTFRRDAFCSLALGALIALAFASTALAMHPRPGGATPLRVPLVTAYPACPAGGGGSFHVAGGAAGALPSCPGVPAGTAPPLESTVLTTGAAGLGSGFVRLDTVCVPPPAQVPPCAGAAGDQLDINVTATMTDVRCGGPPVPPPIAPFCPGGAGTDYLGPVAYELPLRLTDHSSCGGAPCPAPPPPPPPGPCAAPAGGAPCVNATVVDFPFDVVAPCAGVGPPGPPGSTCAVVTSFDVLAPGTVLEEQRMSFGTYDEIVAIDPGPVDGAFAGAGCPPTCRTGDEGTHRRAGQFAP